MLDIQQCGLVVIDVQGKLARLMYDQDALLANIRILIQSAEILEIPLVWCQQCPDALGPTLPEIAELLAGNQPINKADFSCCGSRAFNEALQSLGRREIVLCGIETHVCVYQTALDLLAGDYGVTVISNAVSSRTLSNRQAGLRRLAVEGIKLASTEMFLFELLKTAEHPKFKQIAKLVK